MAIVSENFQDIAGVDVRSSTIRTNPNGTAAAQIVGAYGAISSEEYKENQMMAILSMIKSENLE